MFRLSRTIFSSRPNRRAKEFLPFEEARSYVRSLGLSSYREWCEWRLDTANRPTNIPYHPSRVYGSDFISIPDWLGYDRRRAECRMLPSAEKSNRGRSSVLKGAAIREQFIEAVQSLSPEIEFQRLRPGQQANLLFRIKPEDSLWLPIQIKAAKPRRIKLDLSRTLEFQTVSQCSDVGVVALNLNSNTILTLDPDDRDLTKRDFYVQETQFSNFDTIIPTLYKWWESGKPKSELELLTRITTTKRYECSELITKQIREKFYEPCGLDFVYWTVIAETANVLLGGKHRLVQRVVTKRADKCGIFGVGFRHSRHPKKRVSPEAANGFDFLVIMIREASHLRGFFVFPKEVLISNRFCDLDMGICAGTVYPPYITATCNKATKAQNWQANFYVSTLEEFRTLGKLLGILES